MKKFLPLFIISCLLCFPAHGTEPKLDTLTIGTESNYPPYEFMKNGELTGFEIELVRELGKRLQKKIVFKDMAFDNLLFAAKSGQVQGVAAGLTPTPDREKQVNFSKPYIAQNPLVIVSLQDKVYKTMDELKGKWVIVNDGFVADAYVSAMKDIKVKKLPTMVEAFMALQAKKADAYIVVKDAAQTYIQKQSKPNLVINALPVGETIAFAISKKFPELLAEINKAITTMETDGSLAALKKKWQIQ
jgi:ABC-type amino acid transport substrate-binding protein